MNFFQIIPILLFPLAPAVWAQTATLRGQVTDQSGAIVPGVTVCSGRPGGPFENDRSSGERCSYSFADLPSGAYTLKASAPSLALRQPVKVSLKAGVQTMNLSLEVVGENQQVAVQESAAPVLSTDAASNAGALVLTGTDLDALPDDSDDLMADLLALAGPAAGPSGGTFFIDGFSGGDLLLRIPSAKFESTRTRSGRSTTSSDSAVSRFSPSRAPISSGAPLATISRTTGSIPATLTLLKKRRFT